MLFSTKAEYGVRLMVELGRQPGSQPVSLGSVAEAENLPLSYLEHLVAKLRKAGLVTSTRGATAATSWPSPPRRSRWTRWSRRWKDRLRRWSASTTPRKAKFSARTSPT